MGVSKTALLVGVLLAQFAAAVGMAVLRLLDP